MNDLDVGVVETSGVPHQPEHQDPVQSHHREEREHRAIQKSRELLRLPVEGQHVANQPWDFFTLREVVVHIPVVLVDPLPARIFEVLLQLLVAERNLHLVVDASQSELLQPTQNGRRVVLLLEVPRVAARVGHHSLSIALGASVPLAVSPGSVSRFIVVAHDVPLRVSWGLLALVSVLVRIEIPSQLLKELACVRAAEQDIVDQVEHSRENEPQIVLQKEGQRDPPSTITEVKKEAPQYPTQWHPLLATFLPCPNLMCSCWKGIACPSASGK